MLASVNRAEILLSWAAGDPTGRVADSVRWHLAHPPFEATWTDDDTDADDGALASV